jgi:alkylated DNA repair protein (DNA oxidative demethylase)
MMRDLFEEVGGPEPWEQPLGPGAVVLHGFAVAEEAALLEALRGIAARSPFRRMVTPGGFRMSVAMANCGSLGWISEPTGYRYTEVDPETHKPWPPMPDAFLRLATSAAARAGFDGFRPDVCLINRYEPGTKLSLHQDKDEPDLGAPIVSVSLGIAAMFLFGGQRRADRPRRVALGHGDVVVWGGPARLRYHGVMPIKEGHHPLLGSRRINLSFRRAGENPPGNSGCR